MLEFHLVHVYACDTNLLVTFHNDTVIRFVIEIGRAVDVVHFHTRGNARDRITVHFTRMDYDHEQAIMLHGKFCKFIQQVRNILRFRLSRLRVMVETVERVEDNDAAATADNEFMSLSQYTIRRNITFQRDMGDVFSQKIFRVRKESLRHATAVLKTVSGEFLNQFAEMIDDGGIFRAKEPDFPLMPQAETQHQFVHPLGFSCTGNSGDVDTSPTFIRADLIHLLPSRFRSGTEAVVEKSPQIVMQVGSGEDTFERNFCCLFDGDTETGDTIFAEMLVGIFTLRTVSHHPAAFSSQPVDEFIAQPDSGRISINGNDDFFQVLEVRLHKTVEPGEVRIGSGRHGDGAFESGGDGRSSIQFPLVDDAGGLPQDGVDVVGNQFGTLHHFEKFRESAKFGVYQLFPFKIVEADATFLFAGLRHKFFLFGDA